MHAAYNFNFLKTVSHQLVESLDALPISDLNEVALQDIVAFGEEIKSRHGVYLLFHDFEMVYVGKADDLPGRLASHLLKLSGRQGVDLGSVGYKALFLDRSMSTAANESLLIKLFREHNSGLWNGTGFGPKDPGQERDTTRPSQFDRRFPIRLDIEIEDLLETETVASLLAKMKSQLPYVFRYDLGDDEQVGFVEVQLSGTERTPKPLLQRVVDSLGPGWKGVILSYGMILYETDKAYRFGETLVAR